MKDKVTYGCLELGSIFGLGFPCFVVLCVLPTPIELVDFPFSLSFDLQKESHSEHFHHFDGIQQFD